MTGVRNASPGETLKQPIRMGAHGRCGSAHQAWLLFIGPWSAFRKWFPGNSGFGKLRVVNVTHLYWQQIKAWDGHVIDSIWITQEHHGPFKDLTGEF